MPLFQSIDLNRTALARILAGLFALLRLTEGVEAGVVSGRISRALHRAITRVLRPAESAARRLIASLARTVQVKASPPRPAPTGLVCAERGKRRLSFQLFDPRKRFFRPPASPGLRPRISFFGDGEARRISLGREPRPPKDGKADGLENAANLALRLQALKAALDDLPRQARRLARAFARREKSPRLKLQGVLRPGPAPGWREHPLAEIDHVLHRCDWLAREALTPDTS